MGWAIRRPDGTYRAWNSHTKDDDLHTGETWEDLDTAPEITSDSAAPTDKTVPPLLAWTLDELNEVRAAVGLSALDRAATLERLRASGWRGDGD
jgi:hypothetical protein